MIAICVPTLDRSEFVIRLLRYYNDLNFKYHIYIGDSSVGGHYHKLAEYIKSVKNRLDVSHVHTPGLNAYESMRELLYIVNEKYCVYLGDDDFIIPGGLEKCLEVLEEDGEIYSACGTGIQISIRNNLPFGRINGYSKYELGSYSHATPLDRLGGYLRAYWVNDFSLCKTEPLRDMWLHKFQVDFPRKYFDELFRVSVRALLGKAVQVDAPYLVRQGGTPKIHDLESLDADPEFYHYYYAYHHLLVELVRKLQNVSWKDASLGVAGAFCSYCNQSPSPVSSFKQKYFYFKGALSSCLQTRFPAIHSFLKFDVLRIIFKIHKVKPDAFFEHPDHVHLRQFVQGNG